MEKQWKHITSIVKEILPTKTLVSEKTRQDRLMLVSDCIVCVYSQNL